MTVEKKRGLDITSQEFEKLCLEADRDPEAMHMIGVSLAEAGQFGQGRRWLEQAWDRGVARAGLDLARLMLEYPGDDPAAARCEAYDLLETVAESEPEARFELALCLFQGIGAPADRVKALEQMTVCAAQGDADCRALVYRFCREDKGGLDPAQREQLMIAVAAHGDGQDKLNLARSYKLGQGMPRSFGRAMAWLARAELAGCENAREQYYAEERELECREQELADDLTRAASGDPERAWVMALRYQNGRDVEEDPIAAGRWFRRAARLGMEKAVFWLDKPETEDPLEAAYELGGFYFERPLPDRDYLEAVKWFHKAAIGGHTPAQFRMGVCAFNGWGTDREPRNAVHWYQQAAKQGNAKAQNNLGACYANGDGGLPVSVKEAISWYQKAAEQGLSIAKRNLGNCYLDGKGVAADARRAVQLFREAADGGDVPALRRLAECYRSGRGVERNPIRALELYRQAAEQGHKIAVEELKSDWASPLLQIDLNDMDSLLAVKGRVAEEDWRCLLRDAARQGSAEAMYQLGKQEGIQSRSGMEWYRRAAEKGHAQARFLLAQVKLEKREYLEGERELATLAREGYPPAMAALAVRRFKRGLRSDAEATWELARQALEQGEHSVLELMADMYEQGYGVETSLSQADRCRQEAGKLAVPVQAMIEKANAGDAERQYKLSLRYEKEPAVAREWLEKAAAGGHTEAQTRLEQLQLEEAVERGELKAMLICARNAESLSEKKRFYRLAADLESQEAKDWLRNQAEREAEEERRRKQRAAELAAQEAQEEWKGWLTAAKDNLLAVISLAALIVTALLIIRIWANPIYFGYSGLIWVALAQMLMVVCWLLADVPPRWSAAVRRDWLLMGTWGVMGIGTLSYLLRTGGENWYRDNIMLLVVGLVSLAVMAGWWLVFLFAGKK